MGLRDLLSRRRMVRNYGPQPVAPEIVEEILECARRAPSAGFSQGQRFVVVQSTEGRARIAALAGEKEYVQRGFPAWFSSAPVHIVLAADTEAYHDRYAAADKKSACSSYEWHVPYWHVDAGASLMLILLAAVEHGLAAGFLGEHNLPGLGALLALPKTVLPVGLVTLGYAAPDRPSSSLKRGREPQTTQVHRERWG